MENREILKMEKVTYYYTSRTERIEILEDAGFAFETGKLYAVMGPSGSGKTTTLMLLGGLDTPKEGEILFQNRPIREIGLQKFRALHSGVVFQSYNLFPYLSACENVEIPMEISGKTANKKERAKELLEKVGLGSDKHGKLIQKLSGGEQQRVAIARALAADTDILLADEPTGNLDEKNAALVQEIFSQIAREMGKCVIVVTHSEEFAKRADVMLHLRDKRLAVVQGE